MLILLYIFLGLLLFDFLIAGCIYYQKEKNFKKEEGQLNTIRKVKSTQYGKTAKETKSPGFVHQL